MCLLKTVGELKVWKNFPKTCNFKLLNKQIYVLKSKTFPDETFPALDNYVMTNLGLIVFCFQDKLLNLFNENFMTIYWKHS